MIKFSEIINSYTRPKFGELSINEKALAKYEEFCLGLIKQLKKKDEVVEKAKKYIQENCYKHYDSYNDQQFYILEDKKELLQILEDKEA